ncbi:MAG TPA: glycosyltransferase family 9 protein [Rhodocyclaceae bacterium]|nr:glycosyltransferase family 9 protein [Rhodocyclaceae bacterium]
MDIPLAEFFLSRYVAHAARRRPVAPLPVADLAAVRRVLLVLTTGIGDAVFSSAAFPSLRAAFPEAEIRLFCRSAWTELFAADPNLDGVIPYPGKFRRWRATLGVLRQFAPELTLVLHGNDPDILPLCYLAGSKYVIRIPTTGTKFPFLLSNRTRAEDAATVPGLHYVDNRLRILDSLGIPIVARTPAIHLAPELRQRVQAEFARRLKGRPYWVLHAHAADAYKNLPAMLVRELIDRAPEAFPGHSIVLTGGAENRAALQGLTPCHDNRIYVAAGRLSLAESAACLAGADAVVAPDTGILHLAAALDRPTLGLFSPTRAALVGQRAPHAEAKVIEKPPTCDPCLQKQCPHRPVTCMGQFAADEVLAALATLLPKEGRQ